MDLSEELLKNILEELRNNGNKLEATKESLHSRIDNLKDSFDEKLIKLQSSFDDKLENIQTDIKTVMSKTTELDVHMKETKKDVEHLEHVVKGNGNPGLKTKVELLHSDHKSVKQDIKEVKKEIETIRSDKEKSSLEDKKNQTTIKVAIITGGLSAIGVLFQVVSKIFF